ncbi:MULTISPECIES: AbfB domain-containing protein [unclassified Streptomyces]|uniref:AbfB domain-containing protein n=1 Tax=unclassified Streptomyces TaxID=2593676 RepID=UPI0004BE0759|nr:MULTISPECIES: AbfB domain-containing protein [unclassified Streptomyces]
MSEEKSQPPQDRPWESGWAPDTTRAPGTRRLWLASALALATITACVTAVTVMENESGEPAPEAAEPTTLSSSAPGGLISFATPSKGGTEAAAADRDRPSPSPTTSAPTSASPSAKPQKKDPEPSPSKEASKPSEPPRRPASRGTSIRSVNYPDRYWRVSDGYVRLDRIGSGSEQREDATFQRVSGLADPSCYSFTTADGRYLRHRSFVLVKDADDGSALFRKDATFCPRPSASSGAVMLESANYPGRFLRHRNFQIRLEPYQHDGLYRADTAFRLVAGLD